MGVGWPLDSPVVWMVVARGICEPTKLCWCFCPLCGGGGAGWAASTLLGPEAARGVVSVWCLRIVEWVRASLWSSCVGHMVDVWASGADEGRGRLR